MKSAFLYSLALLMLLAGRVPGYAQRSKPASVPGQKQDAFGTVVGLALNEVKVACSTPKNQKLVFFLDGKTQMGQMTLNAFVHVLYVAGSNGRLQALIISPADLPGPLRDPKKGTEPGGTQGRLVPVPAGSAPQQPVDFAGLTSGESPTPERPVVIRVASFGRTGDESPEDAAVPREQPVTIRTPDQPCRRFDKDWQDKPITIAILNFRTPHDDENGLDDQSTRDGSDLADETWDHLQSDFGGDARLQFIRGDGQRVFVRDFAGAARLGRQMGVDAVLAAALKLDVDPAGVSKIALMPGSRKPKSEILTAGLIESCTGQVLMKYDPAQCTSKLELTSNATLGCLAFASLTASSRRPNNGDFVQPLVTWLEANPPPESVGVLPDLVVGTVGSVRGGKIAVIHLKAGVHLQAGQKLYIHTARIAKNLSTRTVVNLRTNLVAILTVQAQSDSTLIGSFDGDYDPTSGDWVEARPDSELGAAEETPPQS